MAQGSISTNGNWVPFEPDRTILLVAGDNRIPTLCYLKGTSPTGACRICAIEVDDPFCEGNGQCAHRARLLLRHPVR